ncbi:hypothetical protein CFC21_024272 [Triticum aestivum]|uniref:DUF3444 domain-containing protein n=3 Tax=Triticum TaxID=4564 RepID=A0A9R1PSS1_TRITD|nr:uncharacterized protein LOC123045853 [Triticum aestivum]KAF7009767.1 hypothetical protein CFC21_024272 [Triticum aestivum]VAH48989.1 unnamed protein product [Triticum turgidum subsp. durum]
MSLHNECQRQQLSGSNSARPQTFWTICPTCGTKYQYHRAILMKFVRCQNCSKPFIAHVSTEQPAPSGPDQQFAGVWKNAGIFSEIRSLQKFEPGQVWALYSDKDKCPNCYALIQKVDFKNNKVHARWLEVCPDGEVEKRLVEDRTVGCGTYRVSTTRGIMIYTDTKHFSHPIHAIFTGRRNSYEIYPRKGEVWALLKGWDICWSSDAHNQKNYKYQVVQVLSDFTTGTSIAVIPLVKIKVFISLFMQSKEATPYLIPQDDTIWFSHCVPHHLMSGAESEGIPEGALELDPTALPLNLEEALACVVPESSSLKGPKFDAKYAGSSSGNKSYKGCVRIGEGQRATCTNAGIFTKTPMVENRQHDTPFSAGGTDVDELSDHSVQAKVLCPEFFNFDQLRGVNQFRVNQVWAVYDSRSCMPRSYARITKVKRAPKFMVHFIWLEFDPTNKEELAWSCGELPVACGQFRRGRSETAQETCMFSHTISCQKSKMRNSYDIYPRKGEVWALFKGWDISWSSDAGNHRNCDYEVVQVVSDFTTGNSIIVMPLVKLKGFVSLFMQSKEGSAYPIPRDSTLRFSHCVPRHLMCGTEREGVPQGSLELDPAALPLHLKEAFASVVPEKSSAKCQEFDAKCPGSSGGNNSGKGSSRAGEKQHATCMNTSMFAKMPTEETRENNTPSAVECTHAGEESDDTVRVGYDCPDSEFYEFSETRLLHKFEPGQIWAIYSDIDKFPNYYAFIENVDLKNNKVQARWLDACPQGEEERRLVTEDRPVGCGTFKVCTAQGLMTYTGTEIAECFSRLVLARPTGRRNEYEIAPRLGEVWAVYKDWKAGWTARDFSSCDYELVEIFCHTNSSIRVRLLRKVDGYRAVFTRETTVETIGKDEYLKFSHQIPCFHLTNEGGGKLRGCLELDPYSVPEEFLLTD